MGTKSSSKSCSIMGSSRESLRVWYGRSFSYFRSDFACKTMRKAPRVTATEYCFSGPRPRKSARKAAQTAKLQLRKCAREAAQTAKLQLRKCAREAAQTAKLQLRKCAREAAQTAKLQRRSPR